ncbi:MAG: DnaJ domain-containing protein [Treponema sp.]|nr:DnaJ domain-containing protein [Treponema sp.]
MPKQAGGGTAFGGFLFLFDEVKKSHYETLGVMKTAGDAEIKRAYFALVRKYQPDRFPEEFKEIRAAYETLSDSQKRAEYDTIGELPPSAAPLFHEAQRLDHFGRNNQAAELYQMILKSHPGLDAVREQYAKSLSANDKTGKASEVWKELCRRHPDNPRYARELGKSYLERGWNKKALAETRRSLALDRSSTDGWSLLIYCTIASVKSNPSNTTRELENVCREALEAIKTVKTDEWKKIHIYTYAFITIGVNERDKARDYLREIIRLIREGGRDGQEEGRESLQEILMAVPSIALTEFYAELREMADLFSGTIDERSLEGMLDEIKIDMDIETLVEKNFPEIFRDLFRILNSEFEPDEKDEIELTAIEFIIIENKSTYDPQVRRLKTEFPDLYALHSSFFNETLRTRDPDKMLYQRSKKIRKLKREAGLLDEDPDSMPDQPIVRTQPKVSRNDPCPCGSGKKYKKCCGR